MIKAKVWFILAGVLVFVAGIFVYNRQREVSGYTKENVPAVTWAPATVVNVAAIQRPQFDSQSQTAADGSVRQIICVNTNMINGRYDRGSWQDGFMYLTSGKSCAVAIEVEGGAVIDLNGKLIPTESNFSLSPFDAAFSPDGKHFVFTVTGAGHGEPNRYGHYMVADGVEGKMYLTARYPQYSKDSQHLGYRASVDGKSYLVIDGVEEEILPNGSYSRWDQLFGGDDAKQSSSQEVTSPDGLWKVTSTGCRSRGFCGDSATVTYLPTGEAKTYGGYDNVISPFFSSDSKHVIYWGFFPNSATSHSAVIVDGVPQEHYDEISNLKLSPDGTSIVYNARLDANVYYVEQSLDKAKRE